MKKYFALLTLFVIAFFISCDRSQDMPDIIQKSKELHINSSIEIGGLRSLGVVETTEKDKSVAFDWNSDTWNNSENKPMLLVCVGGESQLLSSDKYSYEKRNTGGRLNISCTINYTSEDSSVKFYLFDKKVKYNNGVLTYPDNNDIYPMGNGNAGYDFVFLAETTVGEIKSKNGNMQLYFHPLGTLILFNGVFSETSDILDITLESDCVSSFGDINVVDGFVTNQDNVKTFRLHRGESSTSKYAIYAFFRNLSNGTLKLKGYNGQKSEKSYSLNNITKYGGNYVVLSTEDNTTESNGHVIRFHSNDGTETIREYHLKDGETMNCPSVTELFPTPYNRTTPDGWSDDSQSGVVMYGAGSQITMADRDIDLYAIWYIVDLTKEKQVGSKVFRGVSRFVEGVTPPSDNEWEQVWRWEQTSTLKGKTAPWIDGRGFYDTSQGYDDMCWAATASNILHWWMDRNRDNIERYSKYNGPRIYTGESKSSEIYQHFKKYWPNESNTTKLGFQWFLRGHSAQENGGGMFADVIKKNDIIFNIVRNSFGVTKSRLSQFCEEALINGDIIGLEMHVHEYTVWGVDFDEEGFVKGFFATDSRDDNNISINRHSAGMVYLDVSYTDNNITMVYVPSFKRSVILDEIQAFSQCKQYWQRYFSDNRK